MASRADDAASSAASEEEVSERAETPANTPQSVRPTAAGRRRVPGRAFAIGFGLFLVIGTAVFTYLARQAQRTREAAFEQMQQDGVVAPPSE